jgi:CrcB protein
VTPVLFVVAAGTGALVRWQIGVTLPRPLGTLLVNLVGSFALGLLDDWTGSALTIMGIGAIGALTTFSTLADDLVGLAARRPLAAAGYLTATLVGGLTAAAAGMAITG